MVKDLGARGACPHWFLLGVAGWGELVPRQRGRGAGQAGTTPQPLAASEPGRVKPPLKHRHDGVTHLNRTLEFAGSF